jgi:hypothetical protein
MVWHTPRKSGSVRKCTSSMCAPNQSLKRDVATADALRVLSVVVSTYNLRYDRISKLKINYNPLERCNAA